MRKRRPSLSLLVATALATSALLIGALPAAADSPPGPYSTGFETNTASWFDISNGGFGTIARQQSGYSNDAYADDVPSATGGFHARVTGDPCAPPAPCLGPFTRWGGYTQTFPVGGYRTYVSIYLDVAWAASHHDARFDFSSAMQSSTGGFLRDFVFNAGTNADGDPRPPGFYVGASTNAYRHSTFPQNTCPVPNAGMTDCRAPAHIERSGWYTFRHTFRDDGGFLAVDMDILNGTSGSVASWTIHPGDAMATVGGNRYGWFANEEIPELAIDDSERTGLNLALAPATATNLVGSTHTVTATATSTDANGHPVRGPGVPVEFDVISGPNAGQTSHPVNTGTCSPSDCTTAANGQVSWTYTSNGTTGTDTIQACFPERPVTMHRDGDEPRTCATATKTWAASSTTGKVTGGGQIGSDPVFSATGVLLSTPALVPSLASLGAQASFGFVIQAGAPPTGNLEYNDKPADVRIKVISYSGLLITGGGCGANTHAEFTGSAEVTHLGVTTTENFTVRVDDCAEPGTADTFRISTTSYSNGGTLIGGNIQIHK